MAQLTRRHVLGLGAGAVSAAIFSPALADDAGESVHGISVFGDLKYPADFHHFDYVNLAAPKGGVFSTIPSSRSYNQSYQTFNSLNAFILKGEGAQGMDLTFSSLMARSGDEPDAMYGLVAKSVRISADKLTYRFTLRPEAKFHDGSKLTAHDAAFSLTTLKTKGHPLILQQMRDMVKAEALDDATLVVTFAEKRARDVPLYIVSLPIFSKAYYATRPFDELTLDIPLGCGPYKVGKFEANRYIEYDRVKDWWGADLPVNRGIYNFDTVRYEFYRDREVAFEGFSANWDGGSPPATRSCRSRTTTTRRSTTATSAISTKWTPMRAKSLPVSTAGQSPMDLVNSICWCRPMRRPSTRVRGSEYPAVVIPVMMQHYAMLQRNLLYTGVTRGKRLVVLVGQKKAVAIAVRNVSGRAMVEAGRVATSRYVSRRASIRSH